MIDLVTEARRFQDFCEGMSWDFCFIGGLAVQHWGEPRLTRDVDASILAGFGDETQFTSAILKAYKPRIPEAENFAHRYRILLVSTASGIEFDISLAALPFEEQMIRRSRLVEYLPGIALRICSAEDLIVLKSFADRPLDWQDVGSIVIRQTPAVLDWEYILSNLEPLVALKEQPEILNRVRDLRDS
jgi:hypothetical protein